MPAVQQIVNYKDWLFHLLRPVLCTVKDTRDFNGIAFHLINDNVRQRRKRKLTASRHPSALPSHVRKIFKLLATFINDRGHTAGRFRVIAFNANAYAF